MTRIAILAALPGLLLVPAAFAQDANESAGRPDDAAWVEDCPPDMMCAAAGVEDPGEGKDAPTHDGACEGEVCAYENEPREPGPEGCIDCMAPVEDASNDAKAATPGPALAASLAALGLAAALLVARRR